MQLTPVHLGYIDRENCRVITLVKGNRSELIYSLNCWIFDQMELENLQQFQLPPLDDWTYNRTENTWTYSCTWIPLTITLETQNIEVSCGET